MILPLMPKNQTHGLVAYAHIAMRLCQPSQLNLVSRRRDLHGQAQPLPSHPSATFTFNAPCSIGLRPVRQARPACDALDMIYVRQTGKYASSFLQIPPRGGHPWCSLSDPAATACKTHAIEERHPTAPTTNDCIVLIGVNGTSARRVGGDASFGKAQRPTSKVVAPTLSG